MGYYEIIREFSEGMMAGMFQTESRDMSWSSHKDAGFKAGYSMRKLKNEKIDEHLDTHGLRPQSVIKLQ